MAFLAASGSTVNGFPLIHTDPDAGGTGGTFFPDAGTDDADADMPSPLLDAGDAALDPCWRMPLDEEYDAGLKSNFADMANIGGRPGGAITAAMFLKRFTGKLRWAHLDVAGTAWRSGANKGATGRPVPLLTNFVLARAQQP